jgi:hypothetical protein
MNMNERKNKLKIPNFVQNKNLDPMFNLENNKIDFIHEIKITRNL